MKIYIRCFLLFFSLTVNALCAQETPAALPDTYPLETPKETPILGKDDSSFTMQLLNMLATLGLLLAVVLLASWALKKMMKTRIEQANESSLIKILEQRPLTHKTIISLIEIGGKEIAVAESANGVTLLCEFPPNKEEEIL